MAGHPAFRSMMAGLLTAGLLRGRTFPAHGAPVVRAGPLAGHSCGGSPGFSPGSLFRPQPGSPSSF